MSVFPNFLLSSKDSNFYEIQRLLGPERGTFMPSNYDKHKEFLLGDEFLGAPSYPQSPRVTLESKAAFQIDINAKWQELISMRLRSKEGSNRRNEGSSSKKSWTRGQRNVIQHHGGQLIMCNTMKHEQALILLFTLLRPLLRPWDPSRSDKPSNSCKSYSNWIQWFSTVPEATP